QRQAAMEAVNPAVIARNHRIEEAIAAGISGDFAPFERLAEALAEPYRESEAFADLQVAPRREQRVSRTFCGT
ncbi:MAG: hypothetical protein K0M47_22700, partial [Rhizobium sp.]|nr:hypothetical protein [Rhizobium sp.]